MIRNHFKARCVALLALGASLFTIPRAEAVPLEPDRLPALGRSVAGTDDTTSMTLNPANLAFMPAVELRWQATWLGNGLKAPWKGHALGLGFPLPFGFATGFRLDFVDPPLLSVTGPSNYQWLTWALAWRASEAFALGLSLERSYSSEPALNALGLFSAGVTVRPSKGLGVSFVAHHLRGTMPVSYATDLGFPGMALGQSFTPALAIRPLGTRALELGLEARYLKEPGTWEPRGTLGVDLPWIGRLRGEFAVLDPFGNQPEPTASTTPTLGASGVPSKSFRAALSLSFYLNGFGGSTELAGGAVTGTALGATNSYNLFTDVAVRGFREPVGLDAPGGRPRSSAWAVRLRIESTPDSREHVALLRKLWALSEESSVDVIVLEIRTAPADSLAHVEELRDALRLVRDGGKRVLCHLEDATGSALYLCAAADKILVNPAGGIRFAGLRMRHFYIASLLGKLGIKADFVRIGPHKSAPEQFTRDSASEVARADTIDLLQQQERWFAGDIARDRGMTVETLRKRIAKGPFVASEAKEAGLVDGVAFDDELEKQASALAGERLRIVDSDFSPTAPQRFGLQRSVALVYVDGDMIDGRSRTIPFLGMHLSGSYTIAETLKRVRENPLFSAVVLRVESPGGSSMAADVMWREVAITARVKPVIVSMGDVAASGGYYVAAPATRIYANPLTITGSIGVFYGKADVSGLLSKIGVNVEIYKTAPRADAESIFRSFTDEERVELERKVGQFYDMFLTRVADGRHMTKQEVDKVAQGRVWTGHQAKERGLVDELGGLRQALREARRRGGLPDDSPIVELPKVPMSLLGQLLGIEGLKAQPTLADALPEALRSFARAMAPFVIHTGDRPLARLEIAPVEQ
jgi:protease-4